MVWPPQILRYADMLMSRPNIYVELSIAGKFPVSEAHPVDTDHSTNGARL